MLATTLPTACSGAARHTNLARPAAALCTPGHVAVPRRVLLLTVRAYQSDTEEAAASSAADRSSAFHALAKEVRGGAERAQAPASGSGAAWAASRLECRESVWLLSAAGRCASALCFMGPVPPHNHLQVAGQLASEFASNEGGPYEKLECW